jgi:hypothetical protein
VSKLVPLCGLFELKRDEPDEFSSSLDWDAKAEVVDVLDDMEELDIDDDEMAVSISFLKFCFK